MTTTAADERIPLSGELQVVLMVAQRELIHFWRAKGRIVAGLVQPLMFLFVLGVGLAPLVGETGGIDFTQFVLPGVLAMTVVTTAIFNGASLVWDREFGFLREMLVSPASHTALMLGKALGGTVVAGSQGALMLVLAPIVGVDLSLLIVVKVLLLATLTAFTLTAFGMLVASRIQKMQSFQVVMQLLLMPLIFLSGAMFPLAGLPDWLTVLTRLNPLTYAVDPFRQVILSGQGLDATARATLSPGIDILGWTLPVAVDVAIVAVLGLVFLAESVRGFGRTR